MNRRPALPEPEAGEEITVDAVADLADRIAAGEIRLIDCREDDEWRFNRLPDADFMPLSRFTELAGALVTGGTPAVVYCHHGMRSLQATRWLRSKGLRQCWSMAGGIELWSTRIDPEVPRY